MPKSADHNSSHTCDQATNPLADIQGDANTTILFVDDEESILDIAREYFTDLGYRVITAENGLEAIALLEQYEFACCFTDINMPGMSGLELAEHIRKKDNTIPVVVMTGYPSLDNTIRTLKNGVVDFLVKPVNLNQMFLSLKRVLRERELFVKNIMLKKDLESKHRIEALNRQLSSRVKELGTLNKIMTGLVSLSNASEMFERMVHIALDITDAHYSAFFLIGGEVYEPVNIAACVSDDILKHGDASFCRDQYYLKIVKEVADDTIPLLIARNCPAERLSGGIGSFIGVPLVIKNNVFGVLIAVVHGESRSLSEEQLYYLSFMSQQAAYLVENLALHENIYENLLATLSALVKTVEARDDYTNHHSNRVTEVAKIIAEHYGCDQEDIAVLDFAGRLHDIGKIGVRDVILLKPAALSVQEYEIIKLHPIIGESIISQLGLWEREKRVIRHHHEWFDGSGYPDGLKQDEIPLLARILSVADVYDAMVSNRPYRKELPCDEVVRIMAWEAGRQFDPDIVNLFIELYHSNHFTQIYRESPT